MTFEVGDKVIYPNHGLGIVERIEDKTILGTTCGFYHLRIVANDTTVLVPVSNVDGVGLRRAISDDEVERLFGLLGDGKIDNHQNWKGRFKDNSDKMRSGSIYEVADVLKSLTFLAKSKSLSFREKRMLDRAKFLIISEVSEVMRETAAAIEGRVDSALERCFTPRPAPAARAKVVSRRAARVRSRRPPRAASRCPRVVSVERSARQSAIRTEAREAERSRGLFVYHRSALIIAAVRSVATYIAVSLYVLFAAPIGMLLDVLFGWKGVLYIFGHGGVRLGLALCRHQGPRRRRRASAARPRRGLLRQPSEQRRSAGPVHRAPPAHAHRLQGGDQRDPAAGARVSARRLRADRSPQQGSGDAIARGRRRVRSATATRS